MTKRTRRKILKGDRKFWDDIRSECKAALKEEPGDLWLQETIELIEAGYEPGEEGWDDAYKVKIKNQPLPEADNSCYQGRMPTLGSIYECGLSLVEYQKRKVAQKHSDK